MIAGVKQAPFIAEHTHKNKKNFIPYIEVAGLVAMIASLEPVNKKEKNGKDKPQ